LGLLRFAYNSYSIFKETFYKMLHRQDTNVLIIGNILSVLDQVYLSICDCSTIHIFSFNSHH